MFVDRSNVTNYTLRDTNGKLAIPQSRTNYLKNTFSYIEVLYCMWNSLPTELRQASSSSKFKADCMNFIR